MAKHVMEESDDDIFLNKKEIEEIEKLAITYPYIDKLWRYYLLRDMDIGKKMYDAIVGRMDILSETISSGKLGTENNKEFDALLELMSKSQSIMKGLMAIKDFSKLGIKTEEKSSSNTSLNDIRKAYREKSNTIDTEEID